jgi:hypothetical protein
MGTAAYIEDMIESIAADIDAIRRMREELVTLVRDSEESLFESVIARRALVLDDRSTQ